MDEVVEWEAVWSADPERVDPDDYPPGRPFAREIAWAPCGACGVQVHAPVLQALYRGVVCPRCGAVLLEPPDEREEWVRRVTAAEDEMSEQL